MHQQLGMVEDFLRYKHRPGTCSYCHSEENPASGYGSRKNTHRWHQLALDRVLFSFLPHQIVETNFRGIQIFPNILTKDQSKDKYVGVKYFLFCFVYTKVTENAINFI